VIARIQHDVDQFRRIIERNVYMTVHVRGCTVQAELHYRCTPGISASSSSSSTAASAGAR